MAFDVNNLSPMSGIEKRGIKPMRWQYNNTASDTVTASGYFAHGALSAKDIVTVIAANGQSKADYYVSAVANGAATVTAIS